MVHDGKAGDSRTLKKRCPKAIRDCVFVALRVNSNQAAMSRSIEAARKPSCTEIAGMVVLISGLCLALVFILLAFDDKDLQANKLEVQKSVEEMKTNLVAARVPDNQVAGLLRIHKNARANEVGNQHFIVVSFLFLSCLIVASFGFSLMLFGKLRASAAASRASTGGGS